ILLECDVGRLSSRASAGKHFHNEQLHVLARVVRYGMPAADGSGDEITRRDLQRGAIQVHRGASREQVIDLLRFAVRVFAARRTRWDHDELDGVPGMSEMHPVEEHLPVADTLTPYQRPRC